MEKTERYLQFPLFLIRDMVINKEEVINKILTYGIYKYSTKFSYTKYDVCKNLVYDYYRKKGELTSYLSEKMDNYVESGLIVIDEDYCGFIGNNFDPADEIEQLETIFETDVEFRNRAIEYYQIKLSYDSLGITGNKENCIKKGIEIEKQIKIKEPMPMLSKKLLFEFRDNEKTEFELTQLLAYMAIKSILGTKQFVKTNKKHIVSRMYGYSSCTHLPNKPKPTIEALIKKYSCRYHIDKLLRSLELDWNVITYSNNIRGVYVAMKNKTSIQDLAFFAETRKQKNRINNLMEEKKQAQEMALKKLNKH